MLRGYRLAGSTNVERVALALAYKGLPIEWVDVADADRAPVRAVSGQDLVPVLVDDGTVVVDSLVILEHLERRFPEPALYPTDPARGAEARIVIDWYQAFWRSPPIRATVDDGRDVAVAAAVAAAILDRVELLLDGRDHLLGPFTAADCALFPFVRYAVHDDEPHDGLFNEIFRDPRGPGARPRLEAWVHRVDARPRA